MWAAVLAALVTAFLLMDLALGFASPVGDSAMLVMPYQMLIGDFARAGELLLWNPWMNGGSPDGIEPQFGALSPLVVAMAWLGGGGPASFLVLFVAVWSLSALGFARLARRFGAPQGAQFALAIAWIANGAFTGHAGHANILHAIAFLPWILLFLDRALLGRGRTRAIDAATAGALWGLAALAGYPAIAAITGLFAAGWCTWRCSQGRAIDDASATARHPMAAAALLTLFALVGLVVLAPNHVGFALEARGYTERGADIGRPYATGWKAEFPRNANALEPRALAGLVHPGVAPAAVASDQTVLRYTDATSAGLHVGLGTLLLAALAVARAPRRSLGLLVLGLLFLGLALGSVLPLRAWLYDLVPPTRSFRHPSLFRIPFLLVLAVLAAQGSVFLARAPRPDARMLRIAFVAILCSAVAAVVVQASLGLPLSGRTVLWWSAAHVVGAAVVVFGLRRGLQSKWIYGWIALEAVAALALSRPLVRAGPERTARLGEDHVASLELGAAGFERRAFAQTVAPEVETSLRAGELGENHLDHRDAANLTAKRSALIARSSMSNHDHFMLVQEPHLLAHALGSHRVFFARAAVPLKRSAEHFALYLHAASRGPVPLIVHGEAGALPPGVTFGQAARDAALVPQGFALAEYAPRALEIHLDPAPVQDGWIYVTERWAPGWRARVDGVATPVVPAGFVWRAVRVERGARVVRFEYQPRGFPALWIASWGTLLCVFALALGRAAWGQR